MKDDNMFLLGNKESYLRNPPYLELCLLGLGGCGSLLDNHGTHTNIHQLY